MITGLSLVPSPVPVYHRSLSNGVFAIENHYLRIFKFNVFILFTYSNERQSGDYFVKNRVIPMILRPQFDNV